MTRSIVLNRAEAEFIVDACVKDGAEQWFVLQDELREQWGMAPREHGENETYDE